MAFACLQYRNRVDLVLIDTYSTLNFFYAVVTASICNHLKLPYIPILHGGNLEKRLKKQPGLSKLLFTKAKCLIAPSLFLKNIFNTYGYTNIHYIPNSISLEKYPFKLREKTLPRLFWLRAFANIYHPEMAISVFKKLKLSHANTALCMVGPEKDGSLKRCREYSKTNKLDVQFTGRLTKDEWISLSNDYSIFINTSRFDNAPVSIIEAMALGIPVVSTNAGGIPFLIKHEKNGLLVNCEDTHAMINEVIKLINDPELAKNLALEARKTAEQFNWEIIKEKWFEILNT
ncbi:glycosyltransferase family 4 protein [Ascidiimonas aurantiaca]|uniref:glycosyltransferase family 4 protein n=1 Tax=Ascidiimonas aurantiaca TaxID=1685432 RepID=UPI0030EF7F35